MRLDKALVESSLVRSRTLAAKLIAEGAVQVNGKTVHKSSYPVQPNDRLDVADSALTQYVSRAGHKLAGALEAFSSITVADKCCLDAGASTGGFTQVLLQRGARQVSAVDVGHHQLAPEIRADERVKVFEGMNVRSMKPCDIGGEVELVVSDLSFISLTKVMPALANSCNPGADLVLMVKPQFEVGKHRIGAGGVVSDPQAHAEALERVKESAIACGLRIEGEQPSPLPGQDGNQEFFLWCTKNPQ